MEAYQFVRNNNLTNYVDLKFEFVYSFNYLAFIGHDQADHVSICPFAGSSRVMNLRYL